MISIIPLPERHPVTTAVRKSLSGSNLIPQRSFGFYVPE